MKTLEEPQKNVVFILATTEFHKVPSTITSRCQIFHFKLIPEDIIIKQLQKILDIENIKYDNNALKLIAKQAFGSMRDALSILDALTSNSAEYLSFKKVQSSLNILGNNEYSTLLEYLMNEDYKNIFLIIDNIIDNGFDGLYFLNGFLEFLMNIFYTKNCLTKAINDFEEYEIKFKGIDLNILKQSLMILNEAILHYRESLNKKLYIKLSLIKITEIFRKEN